MVTPQTDVAVDRRPMYPRSDKCGGSAFLGVIPAKNSVDNIFSGDAIEFDCKSAVYAAPGAGAAATATALEGHSCGDRATIAAAARSSEHDAVTVTSDDGVATRADRGHLAARSRYFEALFRNPGFADARSSVLHVGGVPGDVLCGVLGCAAPHRPLRLTAGNVAAVLQAADQLGVDHLKQQCCDLIVGNLSACNSVCAFSLADTYSCADVRAASKAYAAKHFDQVVAQTSADFALLSAELALELASAVRTPLTQGPLLLDWHQHLATCAPAAQPPLEQVYRLLDLGGCPAGALRQVVAHPALASCPGVLRSAAAMLAGELCGAHAELERCRTLGFVSYLDPVLSGGEFKQAACWRVHEWEDKARLATTRLPWSYTSPPLHLPGSGHTFRLRIARAGNEPWPMGSPPSPRAGAGGGPGARSEAGGCVAGALELWLLADSTALETTTQPVAGGMTAREPAAFRSVRGLHLKAVCINQKEVADSLALPVLDLGSVTLDTIQLVGGGLGVRLGIFRGRLAASRPGVVADNCIIIGVATALAAVDGSPKSR